MQFCMEMNKKTQEIWKINCNAFCIRAEKMKRNVKCSYILTERMITSIVRNHNLFKKLTFCSKDIKSLMNIVKRLIDERVVVLHPSKDPEWLTISITNQKQEVIKEYAKLLDNDKPNIQWISKSDAYQIKKLISNNIRNNLIVIKRMKYLLQFELLWIYKQFKKDNNYEHKTPSIVESYRDFIERIRNPYCWQSISNPFPKYWTFEDTEEPWILQNKSARMIPGRINGTCELLETLKIVKILRHLSSKSLRMHKEKDIFGYFHFSAEPGRILFIKDNSIYAVSLNSASIEFNGRIEDSKSINKDWTLFSI